MRSMAAEARWLEALRALEARIAELTRRIDRSDAFEPTADLPRVRVLYNAVALLGRDLIAAHFLMRVVRGRMYEREGQIAELRAEQEERAAALESLVRNIGAFESRPEVFLSRARHPRRRQDDARAHLVAIGVWAVDIAKEISNWQAWRAEDKGFPAFVPDHLLGSIERDVDSSVEMFGEFLGALGAPAKVTNPFSGSTAEHPATPRLRRLAQNYETLAHEGAPFDQAAADAEEARLMSPEVIAEAARFAAEREAAHEKALAKSKREARAGMKRKNPKRITRDLYKPPPPPQNEPGKLYDWRDTQAWNEAFAREKTEARKRYMDLLPVVVGRMQEILRRMLASGVLEHATPQKTVALYDALGMLLRDAFAANFLFRVVQHKLYEGRSENRARLPGASRKAKLLDWDGFQKYYEDRAEVAERILRARGRFEAREEVYGARVHSPIADRAKAVEAAQKTSEILASAQRLLEDFNPYGTPYGQVGPETMIDRAFGGVLMIVRALGHPADAEVLARLEILPLPTTRKRAAELERLAARGETQSRKLAREQERYLDSPERAQAVAEALGEQQERDRATREEYERTRENPRRPTMPGKKSSAIGRKFDRCVKSVRARGGAYDPEAVCAASLNRSHPGALQRARAAARRSTRRNCGCAPAVTRRNPVDEVIQSHHVGDGVFAVEYVDADDAYKARGETRAPGVRLLLRRGSKGSFRVQKETFVKRGAFWYFSKSSRDQPKRGSFDFGREVVNIPDGLSAWTKQKTRMLLQWVAKERKEHRGRK